MKLVVFLAGKSTRFGSLKQYEPIDNIGSFVVDYSLKNAKKAGFNEVIFVIRREHIRKFKSTIYKRWNDKLSINYVIQNPFKYGTKFALLSCLKFIDNNLLTINGDDYYPLEVFEKAIKHNSNGLFLTDVHNTFFKNTIGNRGIPIVKNAFIESISENEIMYDSSIDNFLVSINSFILDRQSLVYLKKTKSNILCDAINELLDNNSLDLKAINIDQKVIGLTYKEDEDFVKEYIKRSN